MTGLRIIGLENFTGGNFISWVEFENNFVKNNANAVRAVSISRDSMFGLIVYNVTLKHGSQSILSPHILKRILWTFIRFEQLHYDFQMAPILWSIRF